MTHNVDSGYFAVTKLRNDKQKNNRHFLGYFFDSLSRQSLIFS